MSTTLVSIRIDNDLLKYLKERADNDERTLSNMIVSILSKEMKRDIDNMKVEVKKLVV